MSAEEQTTMLKSVIDGNLNALLTQRGMTYDDLHYIKDRHIGYRDLSYQSIDDIQPTPKQIPAISFFSGAGGLDIGFALAGFDNIISIENNEIFCNTLRVNNKNKVVIGPPVYEGDIRNRELLASQLRELGISSNFNGVFHGGPPCQSFSVAATQRFSKNSENFKRKGFEDGLRGGLFFDYIWFIKEFKPLAFLIENVSGIMDFDTDGRIADSLQELETLGYKITKPTVLNAAYYNVPQVRRRWIVMGTRGDKAINIPTPQEKEMPCGPALARPLDGCTNHITRQHSAESVLRYMMLDYGARDKQGRVDRLDPMKPSKTVIAGGTKGGGRSHLHPDHPRTLSVRECARLQTFPDKYVFTGSTARQFTQVGNAVPPMLAYQLACEMMTALSDYKASYKPPCTKVCDPNAQSTIDFGL